MAELLFLTADRIQYATPQKYSLEESMAHTLRPLSLGQLLNKTFNIYRRNLLLFLGISAIPNGVLLLVLILFDKTLGTIWNGIGVLGYLEVLFTIVAIVL